jgi:outer membrane lipopolysaccharide assembly protein LptE/RlpB
MRTPLARLWHLQMNPGSPHNMEEISWQTNYPYSSLRKIMVGSVNMLTVTGNGDTKRRFL